MSASVENTAVSLLKSLLQAYSPSGEEEEAVRVAIEWARAQGLDAWKDSSGSLYASPGDREARVLLAGHIDTVPGFIEVREEAGRIYGRGAVDAKGPLTAMLVALSLIAGEARRQDCPVAVAGLSGEEADSPGARRLVESGVPPYVVIGEPSSTTKVIIGYRGGALLRIVCRGRGGHASTPWAGDSALEKLVNAIVGLREKFKTTTVKEPSLAFTVVSAGEDYNVIPSHAEALADLRIPWGYSLSQVIETIEALLPPDCSLEYRKGLEPVRVPPSNIVPRSLTRAIIQAGGQPQLALKAGSSDMNHLAPHTRGIAAYGPGDSSLSHTTVESITREELLFGVRVYEKAVLELCVKTRDDGAVPLPPGV